MSLSDFSNDLKMKTNENGLKSKTINENKRNRQREGRKNITEGAWWKGEYYKEKDIKEE